MSVTKLIGNSALTYPKQQTWGEVVIILLFIMYISWGTVYGCLLVADPENPLWAVICCRTLGSFPIYMAKFKDGGTLRPPLDPPQLLLIC